ncbi:MAG: class I SAM-dependent methyltransferase [Flavobacteriales bacterium]
MSLFRSTTYTDPVVNANATEFEVNNWIISDFVLKELVPVVGVRPFPLSELMLMAGTVCRFRPAIILDWGTHIGVSARVFRETVRAFGIPCAIHSIDLPDDVEHGEHPKNDRGRLVRGMKEVTLHQGDGVTRGLELCEQLPRDSRALFYVDGDHSHASVTRELSAILAQRPDSIVLLHDTFYQSPDSGYNVGPHEAIAEVLAAQPRGYKRISTNTGLPGMTLIHPDHNATTLQP